MANNINLNANSLILKHIPSRDEEGVSDILLQAQTIHPNLESIISNGVELSLVANETSDLKYPAIQYAKKSDQLPSDPKIKEKYIRLRRILMEFRSHSKGTLAKFKDKIEHERVLMKNGWEILERLKSDRIVTASGVMYFLHPDEINKHLGISWNDLRTGKTSEKLIYYLRSIKLD